VSGPPTRALSQRLNDICIPLDSGEVASTAPSFSLSEILPAVGLGSLVGNAGRDSHLLGQHTVRMSPISTAKLNPHDQTFCIAAPGESILIPVLLNNTNPVNIKYTLAPLGYVEDASEQGQEKEKSKLAVGQVERYELNAKDLKAIEHSRQESLQVARTVSSAKRDPDDYDYDEYDDEDEDSSSSHGSSSLQKSQSLVHIRINKPGSIRLEEVLDSSGVGARLIYPTDIPVVPCPQAGFSDAGAIPKGDNMRCAAPGLRSGAGEALEMKIDVYGVPPLSLKWRQEINGKREPFMVEGIEGEDYHTHRSSGDKWRLAGLGRRAPQNVTVPLTVTLDTLGTYLYVLESVSDALGNVMHAGSQAESVGESFHDHTTRSVTVLSRPSVSFRHCGAGSPASLLIGSETSLSLALKGSDQLDTPWNVKVNYAPPSDDEVSISYKNLKAWTKTVTSSEDRKDVVLRVNTPGEYSIAGVKGKYCDGDVLSPDTCKVIERPIPTAEIEWKKIHEWSVFFLCYYFHLRIWTNFIPVLEIRVSQLLSSCMVHHPSECTILNVKIRGRFKNIARLSAVRGANSRSNQKTVDITPLHSPTLAMRTTSALSSKVRVLTRSFTRRRPRTLPTTWLERERGRRSVAVLAVLSMLMSTSK
jgi:nucleoporin POM152